MTAITERKVLNLIDTSSTIQRILQKLDEHDARFEAIDRRFEQIEQKIDLIFNQLDKIITIISRWEDEKILLGARIEQHEARITFLETDSIKKK